MKFAVRAESALSGLAVSGLFHARKSQARVEKKLCLLLLKARIHRVVKSVLLPFTV